MTDDFDALFPVQPEHVYAPSGVDEDGVVTVPGYTAATAIVALENVTPSLGAVLSGLTTFDVKKASIEERQDLVTLHARLDSLIGALSMRKEQIEMAFRRGLQELGADQLPLPNGRFVTIERPAAGWRVRAEELRRALTELIPDGVITKADIDGAIAVQVAYKADNRKLNALASHRGDAVAATIEEFRERETPSPLAGKMNFPR